MFWQNIIEIRRGLSMKIYDNPTAESEIAYNTERATYGAMGSALGTGAGVLIALFFMAMIYVLCVLSLIRWRDAKVSRLSR